VRLVAQEPETSRKLPDMAPFRDSLKVKGKSLTKELISMRKNERN
jgi:hypothetical protein